jgi:hypothetical protein
MRFCFSSASKGFDAFFLPGVQAIYLLAGLGFYKKWCD